MSLGKTEGNSHPPDEGNAIAIVGPAAIGVLIFCALVAYLVLLAGI